MHLLKTDVSVVSHLYVALFDSRSVETTAAQTLPKLRTKGGRNEIESIPEQTYHHRKKKEDQQELDKYTQERGTECRKSRCPRRATPNDNNNDNNSNNEHVNRTSQNRQQPEGNASSVPGAYNQYHTADYLHHTDRGCFCSSSIGQPRHLAFPDPTTQAFDGSLKKGTERNHQPYVAPTTS